MEPRPPYVYLIHRSEDKPAAKQLAESLLEQGIDVWFDDWEIVGGDLVVRKMEEGMTACDGALVLVSEHGVGERWAGEEYDAALAMVHAESPDRPRRFLIPVLHGDAPKLTPFLKNRRPHPSSDIAGIANAIYKHFGFPASDKPPLGKLRIPEGPLELHIELERDGDDITARWGEHEGRTHLPKAEAKRLREALLFARFLELTEALASADPNSVQAQRYLSVALNKLGSVEVDAGNLQAARLIFVRYLDIAEELAKTDQHSVLAQRDLPLSLSKLGDVEVAAGNLEAARILFTRSLEVAEALASIDPHSALARRYLSVSLDNMGDVEVVAGNLYTARILFTRSLKLRNLLASADPHNTDTQRELSVSLNKLGDVEARAGNLQAARTHLTRSLEIMEALTSANPHSALAQRYLSISLDKLGDVEVTAGNLQAARILFARSLKVAEGLASADPHSALARRDLAVSLDRLGDVEMAAGNLQASGIVFARSLTLDGHPQLAAMTVRPHDLGDYDRLGEDEHRDEHDDKSGEEECDGEG